LNEFNHYLKSRVREKVMNKNELSQEVWEQLYIRERKDQRRDSRKSGTLVRLNEWRDTPNFEPLQGGLV